MDLPVESRPSGLSSCPAVGPRSRWQALGAWILVLGLGGCGLANVRWPWGEMGLGRKPPESDAPRLMIARFEPLAGRVPPGTTLGYYFDQAHANLQLCHPHERFYLAQYALAPLLVERSLTRALVLVDSDDPSAPPALAAEGGWTLLVDLKNGVRLYRTPHKDS